MKKIIEMIAFLLICSVTYGQDLRLDTLLYNGNDGTRINIVFTGDGYTKDETELYQKDLKADFENMFKAEPFVHYKNFFNVFSLQVVSKESGVKCCLYTDPCKKCQDPDNYYGSIMEGGTSVSLNESKLINTIRKYYPNCSNIVVLVNTKYYFGTAYWDAPVPYCINPTEEVNAYTVLHEVGHSIGKLADEYYDADYDKSYFTNMLNRVNLSNTSDTGKIKWKPWLTEKNKWSGIDIYKHSSGIWRPHENCRMKECDKPYCSVCKEGIITQIYKLTENRTLNQFPGNDSPILAEKPITFSINPVSPEPNNLMIDWYLDGASLSVHSKSYTLDNKRLSGKHKLKVVVTDTTSFIQNKAMRVKAQRYIEWSVYRQNDEIFPCGNYLHTCTAPPLSYEILEKPHYDTLYHHIIYFEKCKYSITKKEMMQFNKSISRIKIIDNGAKCSIIATADSIDTPEYNLTLSENRAHAGDSLLSSRVMIPVGKIVKGMGESIEFTDLAKNRKTEILIYSDSTVVSWWTTMDEVWKAYFSKLYNITDPLPTPFQLKALLQTTYIYLPDSISRQIKTLLPLEYLTELYSLSISSSGVTDLTPLKYCKKLTSINCYNCSLLEDITGVIELPNLKSIDISYTKVKSLDPLCSLNTLESIRCINLGLTDLSPLYNKAKLSYLECSRNAISDLCPISGNTAMTTLNISENQISSLVYLQKMSSLRYLYCSGNKISSLLSVSHLPISYLDASRNEIWFFPTKGFSELYDLNLSYNYAFSGIEPISRLSKLRILDISSTGAVSLETIDLLVTLETLKVNNTKIASYKPLNGCKALTYLQCRAAGLDLVNLGEIGSIYTLSTLDISNNIWVTQLDELGGLANLKTLICAGTRVTELNGISHLQLTALNIQDTKISSLIPMQTLSYLNISHTTIADLSPLSDITNMYCLIIDNTRVSSLSSFPRSTRISNISIRNSQLEKMITGEKETSGNYLKDNLFNIDFDCIGTSVLGEINKQYKIQFPETKKVILGNCWCF